MGFGLGGGWGVGCGVLVEDVGVGDDAGAFGAAELRFGRGGWPLGKASSEAKVDGGDSDRDENAGLDESSDSDGASLEVFAGFVAEVAEEAFGSALAVE